MGAAAGIERLRPPASGEQEDLRGLAPRPSWPVAVDPGAPGPAARRGSRRSRLLRRRTTPLLFDSVRLECVRLEFARGASSGARDPRCSPPGPSLLALAIAG